MAQWTEVEYGRASQHLYLVMIFLHCCIYRQCLLTLILPQTFVLK